MDGHDMRNSYFNFLRVEDIQALFMALVANIL